MWIEFMLVEELGFSPEPDPPWSAAFATFAGFLMWGLIPVAPFIVDTAADGISQPGSWSLGLTAAAFMAIGYIKGVAVGVRRWSSALHTLAVGGSAAAAALLIGHLLKDLA